MGSFFVSAVLLSALLCVLRNVEGQLCLSDLVVRAWMYSFRRGRSLSLYPLFLGARI